MTSAPAFRVTADCLLQANPDLVPVPGVENGVCFANLPARELEITATAMDDETEIHALRHREFPIWGVQFHPESILTEHGREMLANFLRAATPRESRPAGQRVPAPG